MIGNALHFITEVLDQFLKNRFVLDASQVVLNSVIDTDGSVPLVNRNKMVISLINIEKETARPYYIRNKVMPNGSYSEISLSEKYNLDVMLSANFEHYTETLKFLTASMQFFQVNTCLDKTNFSQMPAGLSRLEFDLEKISYHQMQNLWTAMGAKYQPSVIYRMRLITLQGDEPTGYAATIVQSATQIQPV